MKKSKFVISIAAVLVLIGSGTALSKDKAGTASSQDKILLSVYRDARGHITPKSKEAAKAMTKIASHNGHITLWLTLNYPFNTYFDPNTEQAAIEAQNQDVRDGFSELLDPMVSTGAVWHPQAGPFIKGPGCYVRATVAGLRRLIKDDRLLQVVAVE